MKAATTSTVLIALLLALPAWAGKLVYAPPPPVLLDDAPENNTAKNTAKNTTPQPPAPIKTASRGQLLYENHCMGCHESVVHVRERRQVKSLAELQAQALRWSSYQNLRWNKEEVGEVVRYLDERYYHTK